MQVSDVTSANSLAPVSKNAQLGQTDFLELMVAQLQNQDPFKPMENGDFLGQMAQFSTVNGLQELNDKFSGLSASISGDQALQAASLIGRDVLVAQENFSLNNSGDSAGLAFVADGASSVVVDIHDAGGQLVRSINVQAPSAGVQRLSWDGLDASGDEVAAGSYRVSARQATAAGEVALPVMVAGQIDAVALGGTDGTRLRTAQLGEINMNAVRELY
ncbi:MAG: flagellar hook assembly protein FlgD [Oceanococcus sp.]